MIEIVSVPAVPWMPERAWTTCVSQGAISGLARANYVPFAPQPYPPGMTAAEYEELATVPVNEEDVFLLESGDKLILEDGDDILLEASELGFGGPPPLDCFPRYVMWREDVRTPDHEGGDPLLYWLRNPGWDYRQDCVPVEPFPPCELNWEDASPEYVEPTCELVGPMDDARWNGAAVTGNVGDLYWVWRIYFEGPSGPLLAFTKVGEDIAITKAEMEARMAELLGGTVGQCSALWDVTVIDTDNPTCPLTFASDWRWCCV